MAMISLRELRLKVLRLIDMYSKKADELRDLYHLAVSEVVGFLIGVVLGILYLLWGLSNCILFIFTTMGK
jgi:hypothetical protein